jgi:hypothetical protein
MAIGKGYDAYVAVDASIVAMRVGLAGRDQ